MDVFGVCPPPLPHDSTPARETGRPVAPLVAQAPPAPLARPQGIAVDAAGRVWVAETLRNRVLIFDALFRPLGVLGQGNHVAVPPGAGTERDPRGAAPLGRFQEPQDVAVTSDGCVLVADTGNDRVQVLDR